MAARPQVLTLLTGPAGIGRTTALTRTHRKLADRGASVFAVRFTRGGDALPTPFPSAAPPSAERVALGWSLIGPVAGAWQNEKVADRAAAAAAAALVQLGEVVLLVDDAQWMDLDSLATLAALVPKLRGTGVRCVCAVRTSADSSRPEALAVLRDLRGRDLVDTVRLAPLTRQEMFRQIAAALQAAPEPALVDEAHRLSRGVPAAVRDAVEVLCDDENVRVVDRSACLARSAPRLRPPRNDQMVQAVRGLGELAWTAAKAVAVLHPLGPAVPALVAQVLGTTRAGAGPLLDDLVRAGVVHRGRAGKEWRFTVPMVAVAILAGLGPFERRHLAATAVDAVWSGSADCPDPDHLADLIVDAGNLVERERALNDLLDHAGEAPRSRAVRRWLAAAVELTTERPHRAQVMSMHTTACHRNGDHEQSLSGALTLLDEYADVLPPGAVQQLQVIAVHAMHRTGDIDGLREIAEGRRGWPGGPATALVTAAVACAALDRWRRVAELLVPSRAVWRGHDSVTADLGDTISTLAGLWTGTAGLEELDPALRHLWRTGDPAGDRPADLGWRLMAALVVGESDAAAKILAHTNPEADLGGLHLPVQAMLALMRGEIDTAADITRRSVATAGDRFDSAHTWMVMSAVWVLAIQGHVASARTLLDKAEETAPPLGHLLTFSRAVLARLLGDTGQARSLLHESLRRAADRGLVVGLDVCLRELIDLDLELGDQLAAERGLAELERVVAALPTGRAKLHLLLSRAIVTKDERTADACLRLARHRTQPLMRGLAIVTLVQRGAAAPENLVEAYEIFGEAGALLARSVVRDEMRAAGIAVHGRREVAAENERLLVALAAGGLSNKELAAALRTSEKSVEGRLSRLFERTGYRSRVELTTAMINRSYEPR
ncbi:AAA family ATPase [Lentzea sp. NPDC059081]|uniref:AAA family ATPase n=1 Tax=Lentzea sp. NPDC059081 TaxID=3346719 RepID=UPI0036B7CD50